MSGLEMQSLLYGVAATAGTIVFAEVLYLIKKVILKKAHGEQRRSGAA